MATKGKNPVIHAEKEVGAMQAILKEWIDKNPDNAELQGLKNMKAGQWDEQTNKAFTLWVIATQTAHNTANPSDRIKVDGWAGDQTLRALEGDPKAADALKNLQNAGLNRFHHRTDAHPPKGQEVAPDVATTIPTPDPQAHGAKANPLANPQPQTGLTPGDKTPAPAEDGLGARVATAAVAGLVGLGGAYTFARGRLSETQIGAARLPAPTVAAVPRLSAPAVEPVTAAPRLASPAAAPKVLTGELMPKGNLPTPTERLVNGTPSVSEPVRAPVSGNTTAGKTLAAAGSETSLLKRAWGSVGSFARGLGYVGLAVAPVEALATTEGSLENKALAAGKSMATVEYALGAAAVLGSAPVAIPAATGLGLKAAWEHGIEHNKAQAAILAENTRPAEETQARIIGTIREKSDFAVELALLNDSKPYTTDEEAAKRLQDETFFKKVSDHYESKLKADTAAGRSEDAGKAQWVLAGLNHFREAEGQRVAIVREHEGPVKAASDPKQQAIPVYDML